MRTLTLAILVLSSIMSADAQSPTNCPQAEIGNSAVKVRFYLPDAEKGYYRGTRFDWSGVIGSLRTAKHEYFGQWFARYDAKLHDSLPGPVEEFVLNDSALGYDEAKPGETFVRIGVGLLRRPVGEKRFNRFSTYEIVDGGHWSVKQGADWIEFVHELTTPIGYAYRYTKRVSLAKDAAHLTIAHKLENTGAKPIATSQYNHNFFVIDAKPTGPGVSVHFPYKLERIIDEFEGREYGEVRGGDIVYVKELPAGPSFYTQFKGSDKASDYDIRAEHRVAGAGVRIRGSRPMEKIVYWSIRTTFCPEAYVALSAAPGASTEWQYDYDFFDLN